MSVSESLHLLRAFGTKALGHAVASELLITFTFPLLHLYLFPYLFFHH